MTHLTIENLVKTFGTTNAVNGVSLKIERGELVSLLGPSGCGKTTLLRMIAGFEKPTAGSISIGERVVNDLPPQERKIGIVFQDYAVFPTMNVYKNVAYGLKIKKLAKTEIHELVMEYLDLVGLRGYEERMPSQLSGGQQQRVALARALAIKPEVLLLDEPLSNLDAALRLKIRREIRKIQQKLGITAIFVTHDQEEALSISDRVFVMRRGDIMQGGVPDEIYKQPNNDFVAGFIGRSNIMYGTITEVVDGHCTVRIKDISLRATNKTGAVAVGQDVWVSVRPQYVRLDGNIANNKQNVFVGTVRYLEYLGAVTKGELEVRDDLLLDFEIYSGDRSEGVRPNQTVQFALESADIIIGTNVRGVE
jgi:ABC-type Fe3+/spermidine/putrescine transport system ATPase subunit